MWWVDAEWVRLLHQGGQHVAMKLNVPVQVRNTWLLVACSFMLSPMLQGVLAGARQPHLPAQPGPAPAQLRAARRGGGSAQPAAAAGGG